MSDYPRPSPSPPPKPYRGDRLVAGLTAILVLWRTAVWFLALRQRPDFGSVLQTWAWYYALYAVMLAMYAWVLHGFAHSRFWAFIMVILFESLSLLEQMRRGTVSSQAITSLLLLYALARLCGLLGQRPFRRHEVANARP